MMTLRHSALIFPLLLAACVNTQSPRLQPLAQAKAERQAAVQAAQAPVEKPLNLPKMELSGAMLYDFLLGEMASQRGRPDLAVQVYSDLASATQDPRVVRRAAQLAFEARELDKAVEQLNLWLKLEPESVLANQMLATLLLSGGKLQEARPYLVNILAANPTQAGRTFLQIYPLIARYPDKEAVFSLVQDLAQRYPGAVEVHLVLAQAAAAAGKQDIALKEVRQAREIQPSWELAALYEAQLLQRTAPQQAQTILKKFLDRYPDSSEVRLLYARLLLEQKQYALSRAEFKRLLDANPDSADLAFTVAMLSLELNEFDRAEAELRQALARGKKDQDTVYYYLGQLAEAKKRDDDALQNYRRVLEGEYAYPAHLRVVYLLNKAHKLEEARAYLHQISTQNDTQRVQLLVAEAQMLRDAKQLDAAYQILAQGQEKMPGHPELIYETAMVADQLGKRDVFEQMMRKVIEIQPDYAQAYNALGYSLLDRNERVQEGMQLVEKANQLAPDDAGIIDSVGWGYYRTGNLVKSVEYLRRAYGANPDPEIAAHLGEVLWAQGEKEQARKVWNEALKTNPDNTVLLDTMKKFSP
ncbi:MAG: tetratricopeptide repeat protein [Pseudomonadota bacterium]